MSLKGGQSTLMNIIMELRKTCNHPYLFHADSSASMTHDEYMAGKNH